MSSILIVKVINIYSAINFETYSSDGSAEPSSGTLILNIVQQM